MVTSNEKEALMKTIKRIVEKSIKTKKYKYKVHENI